MEPQGEMTALNFATLVDSALTSTRTVMLEPKMFVNWADLPSVTHVEGDHWLAHWLRYSAEKTYTYDVVTAQSFDDAANWTEPVTAHSDGTQSEHGFVSMYRDADGVALLWLDGRKTVDPSTENPLDTAMTLRTAIITPRGEKVDEHVVDESVCDCCQTDVAVSSKGPIAVYRDRTSDEIRDIYVARFIDGAWQAGERLHADNWQIAGCPVNGPAIVAEDDLVAVAWFAVSDDSPRVRAIVSRDGGESFGQPIDIAQGRLSGYVGLAALPDQSLAVSWVGKNESGNNALQLRLVSPTEAPGPHREISEIEQLRVFPQLGYQDDHLFLFWTDDTDSGRKLQGVRVPVAAR
jgi:hypothetical protein